MNALELRITGIGAWWPQRGDWPQLRAWLRGEAIGGAIAARPPAGVLPQGERRRAPLTVLLACEVAAQACAMAGHAGADLPCVFSSAHGEVAISHDMCATLASEPLALSPTRFHNSVHNAAVGYWTLATQCHEASSALSAWHGTLGAGLFEAAVLACAESRPVLFTCYEAAAEGPLARVLGADSTQALALVLDPDPTAAGSRLRLRQHATTATATASAAELLRALALQRPAALALPAGIHRQLEIEITP